MNKLISVLFCSSALIASSSMLNAQEIKEASKKNTATTSKSIICSNEKNELRTAMRKLWEDHITYTRNYIISAIGDLKDKDAVAQRLLKNQDDIGNAVKVYYGVEAGNKLSKLLKEHILIAADVVAAAKANDKNKLDAQQKKWKENADEISIFLSNANPNWSKQQIADMLYKHLDLTTGEVVGRLKMNWQSDIDSYDKGHEHMLKFSDVLTDGITNQFPDKFSN